MGNKQPGYKSDVLNTKSATMGALLASLGGPDMVLDAREFKSGKVGFGGNGTVSLKCGSEIYKFSAGVNCTGIDSEKSPMPEGGREAILASGGLSLKDLKLDKVTLSPREFKSGKVGYYFGDKVTVTLDGKQIKLQVGCNLTAWHSDGWAAERPAKQSKQDEAGV